MRTKSLRGPEDSGPFWVHEGLVRRVISWLVRRVSNGYTPTVAKDSGLRIRVERELRDKFLELCRAQDRPAAQVLREFMRDFVSKHPANDLPLKKRKARGEQQS